jgi:hypothetical protein
VAELQTANERLERRMDWKEASARGNVWPNSGEHRKLILPESGGKQVLDPGLHFAPQCG